MSHGICSLECMNPLKLALLWFGAAVEMVERLADSIHAPAFRPRPSPLPLRLGGSVGLLIAAARATSRHSASFKELRLQFRAISNGSMNSTLDRPRRVRREELGRIGQLPRIIQCVARY